MKLGTHNSMTYLPVKKWYLLPFKFMAKCQNIDIEEQYNLGVRMFDLRISYDNEGKVEFKHGLMSFKGDVNAILKLLNSKKKSNGQIYVRLLLEVSNKKQADKQLKFFLEDCSKWEDKYRKLKFFCGRTKYNWKQVYKFKEDDIDIVQKVSSMTKNKIDDLWPWLFAYRNNLSNFQSRDNDKWLLLDFIELIKDELG